MGFHRGHTTYAVKISISSITYLKELYFNEHSHDLIDNMLGIKLIFLGNSLHLKDHC